MRSGRRATLRDMCWTREFNKKVTVESSTIFIYKIWRNFFPFILNNCRYEIKVDNSFCIRTGPLWRTKHKNQPIKTMPILKNEVLRCSFEKYKFRVKHSWEKLRFLSGFRSKSLVTPAKVSIGNQNSYHTDISQSAGLHFFPLQLIR